MGADPGSCVIANGSSAAGALCAEGGWCGGTEGGRDRTGVADAGRMAAAAAEEGAGGGLALLGRALGGRVLLPVELGRALAV